MESQTTPEYAREMSTRTAIQPAKLLKVVGVVFAVVALLFIFMVANSRPPLWLLEVGMLACLTGMLAWPPKTLRVASVWVLWLSMGAVLAWTIFRPML